MKNEEIIQNLKRQLECYEKILELTKKQVDQIRLCREEAIESDNIKELNLIITAKENHIKDIKYLDRTNIKLQRGLSSALEEIVPNIKNPALDKRINSLLKQIRSIITKIKNYDDTSIKLLSSLIEDLKTRSSNLTKRRRTLNSLKRQKPNPSNFIDVVS